MTIEDRIKLQTAEFDAVAELAEQYRRITLTPIVDDDYPEVRYDYERAVRSAIAAFKANSRLERDDERWRTVGREVCEKVLDHDAGRSWLGIYSTIDDLLNE
jgi:hypothetical protein